MMLRLDRIEGMVGHNATLATLLQLQLLSNDKGYGVLEPKGGPEAKAAQEAEANYQRVRKEFEAKQQHWDQTCEDIEDFKDQNVLLMAAISAMLTFLGFQLGKSSERSASNRRKK